MIFFRNGTIFGKTKLIFGLKIVYWGRSQWYKFRWHKTHIDLGIFSIYKLPQNGVGALFWRMVAILVKPLRWWYHKKYVYSIGGQINNILNVPTTTEEFGEYE